jgi:hypothetical protein
VRVGWLRWWSAAADGGLGPVRRSQCGARDSVHKADIVAVVARC